MSKAPTPVPSFLVCRGVQARAEYMEPDTPIYKDNPFIEALPPVLDEDQAIKCLARYPDYDESERLLPNHVRLHMIQNALHFFAPLPIHLDLEQRVSRMIREGYRMRNPMGPGYWRETSEKLKSYEHLASSSEIRGNDARTLPHGFTMIGVPGVGKSTSLEAVLSLYPQVIFHGRYKERDLTRAQIVWLKLEAPFDSSTKGICLNFFQAVDDMLETSYERNYTSGRRTDELLLKMARVAANHGLGVLVIDEIQRLSYAKSGGAEKMLNFFVQLSNTIGIPVVLVGTFKARKILSGAVHQIRRGAGQGDMVWDRMPEGKWVADDDGVPGVWQLLLESLWRYQYTRTPCPLTAELAHALYEQTQGITDFAAKVFMLAQARAITTSTDGNEQLTKEIIRSVAVDSLRQAQPVLQALRMGDTKKLDEYDDMRHIDVNPYLRVRADAARQLTLAELQPAKRVKKVKNPSADGPKESASKKPRSKTKQKRQTAPADHRGQRLDGSETVKVSEAGVKQVAPVGSEGTLAESEAA